MEDAARFLSTEPPRRRTMDRSHLTPLAALSLALLVSACSSNQVQVDEDRQLEIYRETAQGYYTLGEFERAKDQAIRGLEIDDDDPDLLLVLGRSMLVTGQRAEVGGAEQIFRRLLKKDDYRPYLGLAIALERKGLFYAEAAEEIASGERYTDAADPTRRAAEHHASAQQTWAEAVEQYERALELSPSERDALNGLLRTQSLLGQDEEALKTARGLLDVIDTDLGFWRRQLERDELRAEDEELYRVRVAELEELEINTRLSVYTLLRRLEQPREALAQLDEVAMLAPERPEVYSRRAEILVELGEGQRAIEDIDRFLSLSQVDFEHPSVRRAFELRTTAEASLRR